MSKQSKAKHDRLLQKSESLFLKYGYKAVSMDQIAKEAGISKMTIYKHYHSKDDLFIAVLIQMTDYHWNIVEEQLKTHDKTMDKIECLYSYSMSNINVVPDYVIKEIMERNTIMEALRNYKQKWTLDMWHRILEEGVKKGEIRPLDIDFTATLLMNMPMTFIQTDYFSTPEKISRLTANFYDFVKYGLLGKAGGLKKSLEEEATTHGEKCPHESGKSE